MRIGMLDGNHKNATAGGTVTYLIKYFFPALLTDDYNEIYLITYNKSGSPTTR